MRTPVVEGRSHLRMRTPRRSISLRLILRCPPQAGLEGEAKGLGMRVAYKKRFPQRSHKGEQAN
jgi:hypothetical protein